MTKASAAEAWKDAENYISKGSRSYMILSLSQCVCIQACLATVRGTMIFIPIAPVDLIITMVDLAP